MTSIVRRGLVAMALAAVASLTLVTPASAECVYPPGASVCEEATLLTDAEAEQALSDTTVTPGQLIIVKNFPLPGQKVYLKKSPVKGTTFSTPQSIGTFTTDATGHLTFSFKVPTNLEPGDHTLLLDGLDASRAPLAYAIPFTVTGSGSGLPFTGAQVGAAALIGATLLGIGSFFVVGSRRRTRGSLAQ